MCGYARGWGCKLMNVESRIQNSGGTARGCPRDPSAADEGFTLARAFRYLFRPPNILHMRHAAFDIFGRQRGAEFKDLDVPGLHHRLERRKIDRPCPRLAMVAPGE